MINNHYLGSSAGDIHVNAQGQFIYITLPIVEQRVTIEMDDIPELVAALLKAKSDYDQAAQRKAERERLAAWNGAAS